MSSSSSASEWLSLTIFSKPTAWLTAQTAVACTHLCKAYLRAFVVCQVNALVATLTGRLACELRLARTTQESHDSHNFVWCFRVFFDGFPYFVAPAFSTPASSTPAFSAPQTTQPTKNSLKRTKHQTKSQFVYKLLGHVTKAAGKLFYHK